MVSQARSQCKTMLVNKALVLSVRRHHARVTHQIMLLVLSSAGARGAKGSNERPVSVIYICILVFLTVFFFFSVFMDSLFFTLIL